MTTGVPIYLVSACASGEEFVSAFRRYADRNGVVFVPIAQPIAPGRKGRFALTLKDGGVMVEGEAEVVSSAKTPSVLYGRVGMTLKFTAPDDPSKTILGELERARTAMKPMPPSVAPRPADVPAEPRPTPPAPTGRIDAVNALAECVVIGDVSALGGDEGIPPRMGNPKFVVPSIPAVGGARPKTPSIPPSPTMGMPPIDKKPITGNQPAIPRPPPPRPQTPSTPAPHVAKETVMGMPALDRAPGVVPVTESREDPTMPTPARAAAAAAAGSRDKNEVLQTVRGPAPGVDLVSPAKLDLNETMRGPAPKVPVPGAPPPRTGSTTPPPIPRNATPAAATPTVPRQPTPAAATPVVARQPTPAAATPVVARQPTPAAATPVVARQPTPAAPLPIAAPPPPAAPLPIAAPPPPIAAPASPIVGAVPTAIDEPDDADEPTDLTQLPIDAPGPTSLPVESSRPERTVREPRKTVIGVAVVPSGVHVLPAAPPHPSEAETRDTSLMAAQDEVSGPVMITSSPPQTRVVDVDPVGETHPSAPKLPSALMNATVEESTPSGDWTMTPGEHGPTIAPRVPMPEPIATPAIEIADPEEDAPIKKIPSGPPTGDWMIALDPSQPDGWSEPSKIDKRPEGVLPPEHPGPPVSTVSSSQDLDSNAKSAPEPVREEPKVQIDPTLIEPLQPLQPIDDFDDEPQLPPPPSASQPAMPPMAIAAAPPAQMGVMHTPLPMPNPMLPGPIPGSYVTPLPGQVTLASASGQVQAYPMDPAQQVRGVTDAGTGFFRDTNEVPKYGTEPHPLLDTDAAARKRRMIVIGASAGGAVLLVIILAIALSGGKKSGTDEPTGSNGSGSAVVDQSIKTNPPPRQGSDVPPKQGSDRQIVIPTPPADAAETAPPIAPDAAQVALQTGCEVDFSTAPQGADIVLDKEVVGTTPAKLKLPCGVESRLTFKKQRYVSAQRAVTPKPEGQKPVRVALARVTFIVKVSSSPPGATIFLGARSLGITPAAVKLPAFETSTLKITKDGYAPDLQKVTPKTNNLSISASLKKVPKKGAPR